MVNKYYQKHKERLRKVARERYQSLSEEEKDKDPFPTTDDWKIFEKNDVTIALNVLYA